MEPKATNRKTFRLDDDVLALLQERLKSGYGSNENDVINKLLRNIPKQEAEILRWQKSTRETETARDEAKSRANKAEAELGTIKNVMRTVGQLLHPPE